MSFFLNQPQLSGLEVNSERMKLAELHYDAMNTTLNTIKKQCLIKCIPDEYGEAELNKGESSCTDRCVAKFMQANRILGEYAQAVRFNERDLRHYEEIKRKLAKD
ncbi:hypothetical protein KL925_001971 [Ogataea polymorpha]|nr:hypothetical protein KL937_001519 [Ogataea polymorpha]KAG7891041.1 hypothetical protein KL936_002325 [Ogataea polymorpha]KAG7918278.1 hypothetical protein KL927_001735 [Ogataea polymorpha]KAG7927613.1 hypothetical protein KL925_001971 [Ogataea polymorpha]KAG7931689.1 hypothetical protein KL934_004101 [Ogataea polymorpha]